MKFGYVRTFGDEPVETQRRALHDIGVDTIFVDANVAANTVFKANYTAMLRQAKPGDEIVVTRLDRLAKRTGALFVELHMLEVLGLSFRSLDDGIATDPGGAFYGYIRALYAFAEGISPRAASGDHPATLVHRKGGQQPMISEDRWQELRALLEPPTSLSVAEVARMAGVSRQAIHKRLQASKDKGTARERDCMD